ncbi:hypothetical protein, partial [Bacillus thuringiensis]|uniref:hypothetical protein n=1 Tax=Bacillus thuringiensis TaxID=1428 RepID=UPI001C92C258
AFDKKSRKYTPSKTTLYYIYIQNPFNLHLIQHQYLHIAQQPHLQLPSPHPQLGQNIYFQIHKNPQITPHTTPPPPKINPHIHPLKHPLIHFQTIPNIFYSNPLKKQLITQTPQLQSKLYY